MTSHSKYASAAAYVFLFAILAKLGAIFVFADTGSVYPDYGQFQFTGSLKVTMPAGESVDLHALQIRSGAMETSIPLDFEPLVIEDETNNQTEWLFAGLVANVDLNGPPEVSLLSEQPVTWDLQETAWLEYGLLTGGAMIDAGWQFDPESANDEILVHLDRSMASGLDPGDFRLAKRATGDQPAFEIKVNSEPIDSRTVKLIPLSGGRLAGDYVIQFNGEILDPCGIQFVPGNLYLPVPPPVIDTGPGPSLAGADLAASIPLVLAETPVGTGLLTAFTSGTFNLLGQANKKVYELELESGDQLSVYVQLIVTSSRYRLRLLNATSTVLVGDTYGTYYPLQRIAISTAGTYFVEVYAENAVSDFNLRVDVGRNIFLEAENNDSQNAANPINFRTVVNGGSYQESTAGALSDLKVNQTWPGSNDVKGDFFDLGSLSSGNTLDVVYQLPSGSTLASGDMEFALFASGAETPVAISTNFTGLSTTIPSDGQYFLRIAPNDNLDGTCLYFSGGTDRVDLPATIVDGLNVFTLEFWARGRTDNRMPFSAARTGQDNEMLVVFENATQLAYYDKGTRYFWTMPLLDEQTWRHFAIVRDGSSGTIELFVDSVSQGSQSGQTTPVSVSHLILGQDQDSPGGSFDVSQAFIGNLDDLRIWETVRTSGEIADNWKAVLSGTETGLRAYFRFNETSGTITVDETVNAYEGTLFDVVFDGSADAVGFNPAHLGIRAQYYSDITIIDAVDPTLVSTTLPAGTDDGYYTSFTVTFSESMDPNTAAFADNYDLRSAGEDGLFDTDDDELYTIAPQFYLHGTEVDIFLPDGPMQPGEYRLQASSGIQDRASNSLVAYEQTFTLVPRGDFIIENRNNDSVWDATSIGPVQSETHDGSFSLTASSPAANIVWAQSIELNGDGLDDAIAIDGTSFHLEIYLNNGDGTFSPGESYPLLDDCFDAVIVNLNGDAHPDVAVANRDDDRVHVFLNNGDATFTTGPVLTAGDGPLGIAAGDFNTDGSQDLIVSNQYSSSLTIFLNSGDGINYTSTTLPQAGASTHRLAAGNFDTTPALDVVFTDNANKRVGFLSGNGDGTFADVVYSEVDAALARPTDVDAGDFNGDGVLDLVVCHNDGWSSSNAVLLEGQNDGTFVNVRRLYTDVQRAEAHVGDINDDGLPDVIMGTYYSVRYFLGTGDPQELFQGRIDFTGMDSTFGIALSDFDNDGRTDFLAFDPNNDTAKLYSGNPTMRPLSDNTAAGFYQALGRGNIRDVDDLDWFAFSAKRGETLTLVTENANPADYNAGLRFQVYNPGINMMTEKISSGTGGRMQISPISIPADGTYYLRVSRNNNYFKEYRFRFTIAPPDHQPESEDNNATTQADPVVFEATAGHLSARVLGQFMPGDTSGDFYALGNLASGTIVSLNFHNMEDSSVSPKLWLYSRNGSVDTIVAEGTQGTDALVYNIAVDGTYFAKVSTVNEYFGFFSEYRLEIDLADNDPPAIVSDTLPAEGSTTNGLLIAFTLNFNEDLYPPSVTNPGNFELRGAGVDNLFNTGDDFLITLGNFNYTAGTSELLTIESNPLQPGNYRFTAFSGGITDLYGNTLPEPDYVREFSVEGIAGYISEGTDNDTRTTADSLSTSPPGGFVGSVTYAGPTGIPSSNPNGIRLLDINNDGILDAAVTSVNDDRLRVYFGNGDATFTAGPDYPSGGDAYRLSVVDFDDNGVPGLALPVRGATNGLRLFRNNQDGTLTEEAFLPGGLNPSTVVSADLDGLNGTDMVMANHGTSSNGSISIYLQQEDGSFVDSLFLDGLGLRPNDVEVAYIDNDGIPDLAFSEYAGRQIGICLGAGDGTFADPVYYPVAGYELGLMAGADFDDDGDFDLAVSHNNHANVSILLNNGDGTFGEFVPVNMGNNRYGHLETFDINADNLPDLILTGDFGIGYRLGVQGDLFPGKLYFGDPASNDARGLDVGLLNGDDLPDMIVVSINNNFLIYLGDAILPLAATDGFSDLYEVFARGRDIIGANNDDYFVFTAMAGQTALVDVENDVSEYASHNYALYDSYGNQLKNGTLYYGYEQLPPVTIPRDGNYYFRISGDDGHDDIYRFRVSLVDPPVQTESEDNNSYSQSDNPTFEEAPGIRQARIFASAGHSSSSADWFGIGNIAENAQVTVTFTQPADSHVVPTISLRANNGNTTRIAGVAGAEQIVYTLNAGEEAYHWVVVTFSDYHFHGRYFLDIAIEDLQAPEIVSSSLPAEGSVTSEYFVSGSFTLSEDVQPVGVMDPSTYSLINAGTDNTFDTADDIAYPIVPKNYTSGLNLGFYLPSIPLQPGFYRFTIKADGVKDLFGNPLASDFVRNFSVEGVVPFIGESLSNEFMEDADTLSQSPNLVHDGSFLLGANYATGDEPRDLLLLRADSGGSPDIIVSSGNQAVGLQLFINDGAGNLSNPVSIYSSSYPDEIEDLVSGDFNGDGRMDVAASVRTVNNSANARVIWLANNGNGSFSEVFSDAAPAQPGQLAVGDLDGDGDLDLVASERQLSPRTVSIFLNDGGGSSFTRIPFVDLPQGANTIGVAVGDLDEDSIPDIVLADYDNHQVILLKGLGDGSFSRIGQIPLNAQNPNYVGIADLDSEGGLDIVVTFNSAGFIDILNGNGDLTFSGPRQHSLRTSEYHRELLIDDINGDGLMDVVVGTGRTDGFTIFTGQRGSGYFLSGPQTYEELANVSGLGVADLNGDGRTDMVACDFNTDKLALFFGTGGMPLVVDSTVIGLRSALARGTVRTGDSSADFDYWTFSVKSGDRLFITTENLTYTYNTNTRFRVLSAGGDVLQEFYAPLYGAGGQNPPIVMTYTGRIFLELYDSDSDGVEYRFMVNLVPGPAQVEVEENDDSAHAQAPVLATSPGKREASVFGVVDKNDSNGDHYFLGNLDGGTSIQIRMKLPDDSLLDPRIAIYRSGDPVLAETTTSVPALDATVPINSPGAYYVRIGSTSATRGLRSTYLAEFTLLDTVAPEIIDTDLSADPSSAFFPSINLTINEDFDPGSVNDPASFELRESGPDGTFDTVDDVVVPLGSPSYSIGPKITLPIPDNPLPAGEYRLTAYASLKDNYENYLPEDFVQYFTMVNELGYLTESVGNNSIETATPLLLESAFMGTYNMGGRGRLTVGSEVDNWKFSGISGQTLVFDTDIPGTSQYTDLQFLITAPDGSTIVLDHRSGRYSPFSSSGKILLDQDGEYSIRIDPGLDSYNGEYRFRVTLVDPGTDWETEPNDTTAEANPVTLISNGDQLSGGISGIVTEITDRDYFSLGIIPAGNTILASAVESANGPLKPVVSVYTVNNLGEDVFKAEVPSGRNGDSVVEIDVALEDEFFVLVRGSGSSGSLVSEYRLFAQVLPTDLANFPNLQVSEVTLPVETGLQSGDSISYSFTVTNVGADPTAVSTWIDRVAISGNTVFGDGDDYQLEVVGRAGALASGESYTVNNTSVLPDGISGSFFIIVRTDTADQVDEFLFEGDNELATLGTFPVTLADYPDLVIENLVIPQPGETGDVTITWQTVNRGTMATSTAFTERVEIVNRITGGLAYVSNDTIAGPIEVDGVVNRSLSLAGLVPSNYRIRIQTDYEGDYFEYGGSGHAAAEENLLTGDFIVYRFFDVATFSSPVEGGTTTGGGIIREGNSVTVTAIPDTSIKPYTFVRWKKASGALLTTDPQYNFVPTGNIDLIAEFELPLYTVTTAKNMDQAGSVTGAGGYRWGSAISIQARPKPGYLFERFENADDSTILGTGTVLPLTITSNINILALFAEQNPVHDVTVATSPADIYAHGGGGVYSNGQSLILSVPATVVEMPTEHIFQRWTLNGNLFNGNPDTSKTFSTLDPPTMNFVAHYTSRLFNPVVESFTTLVSLSTPLPSGKLFGVTLRFDREMDTSVEPVLTLVSGNAAVVPQITDGRWLDTHRWESGTLQFVSDNSGNYTLQVSAATSIDDRTMDPADVVSFTVDATPPPNPVLSISESGNGFVTVDWTGYAPPADLNNFRVYRDTSPYGTVTPAGAIVGLTGASRQYKFTGLELDKDYHVAVVAVDTRGNANNSVSPLAVRIDSDLPPAVNPVLIRDAPDSAMLDWSAYVTNSLLGFEGFHVYRSETPFSNVSGMSPVATLPASQKIFQTGILDRQKTYYFAVVGYNRIGDYDPDVNTVSWKDPLSGDITEDLVFGGDGQAEIEILAPMTLKEGATLTILPGTRLLFMVGASITVENGVLYAVGNAFAPIIMTSYLDDGQDPPPFAGIWDGIQLLDTVNQSFLEHVWILYGKGLHVAGSGPVVHAVGIMHNDGDGVRVTSGASFSGSELYLAYNGNGLAAADAGSTATITGSVIRNNSGFGILAGPDTAVSAVANWWGTTDAGVLAGKVSGIVDTSGFLQNEPLLGLGFELDSGIVQTTNNQIDFLLACMNASAYRISEDSAFVGVPFANLHAPGSVDSLSQGGWIESFSLSEGSGIKTIYAEFLSPTGGLSETLQLQIELLSEGPVITAWSLFEGMEINRPVPVNAASSSPVGIRNIRIEVNGSPELVSNTQFIDETWNISGYASGIYRLRLVAEDISGNLATQSINITLNPDPPPAPVITSPSTGIMITNTVIEVTGTAEPGVGIRVTVNGTNADSTTADGNGDFAFTGVPLLEGSNALVVIAFDEAGSRSSAPVVVISDTLSPLTPVMEEPLYDPETGLIIQWRFPEEQGERPVSYKVYWNTEPFASPAEALGASDQITTQSWTFEEQSNGLYYFRVIGFDAANNPSAMSEQVSTDFDDTPPVISIYYDKPMPVGAGVLNITLASNELLNATPSLTILPEGRNLPISVPLTNINPLTWEASFTISDVSMRSGVVDVRITARDQDKNLFIGEPVGVPLTVDLTRPTGVLRTNVAQPLQVLNPEQIELTLELSEPVKVGTIPRLRWSPPTGAEVEIDLQGAEDVWTGVLTLFPDMGKGDGLFLMEAIDAVDNVGTRLTEGSSFEIYNTLLPIPPGPPQQLLAEALPGGHIRLRWSQAYRAVTYNVYRVPAGQEGIPNVLVAEGIGGTEFTDLPPIDGIYRYVIRASRYGAEGDPSPSFTITSDRTPPPPPENIGVSLGTNGVIVTFDPPSSGEVPHHYVLYRNGGPLSVTTMNGTFLRDHPPRGVMEYQVASSDYYGNHSLTEIATIEMFLGPVKNVDVLVENGEPIRLAWVKTDSITEGYNIYRNGARQNPVILSSATYSDPLGAGGNPVTYGITAVNDQGQESARREIVVQPVEVSFLLNPDEKDEEFNSIAGYFDNYKVIANLDSGSEAVAFSKLNFSRELSDGTTLSRSLNRSWSVGAGAEAFTGLVVPSPIKENFLQTTTITLITATDEGGGKVSYRGSRELSAALGAPSPIQLTVQADQPPLAGGLTDFAVDFTNYGLTEVDVVLTRDNGSEPGEFSIRVVDQDNQEVAVTPMEGLLPGLTLNPQGDGFFRLAPGESRSFIVPDVFVPIALAEQGEATFIGRLDNLFHKTGSAIEEKTGPLLGLQEASLTETDYYGTSSTPRDVYSNEEIITITGQSIDRITGAPIAGKALKLGFEIQGFKFYQDIMTDENGDYSYDFEPTIGVGGEINIWAAHPDVVDQLDQTTVVLYRSLLSPIRGNIKMSKNDYIDFQIKLINPGDRNLTNFTVETRAYTVDAEGNETDIESLVASLREPVASPLGPRKRTDVKLRLTSTLDAPDNAIVEITLISAEGARSTFTGFVTLLPAFPILDVVSPRVGYVDMTLNKGGIISKQVTVTNSGLRPLEDVVIVPPQSLPWMQLNMAKGADGLIHLPDLEVGDTFTLGVVYTPPSDTPVGYYDDFILIQGSNAVSDYRLNLFAQVSSSEKGNVEFFIDNNLVLPIPNASIRLRNVALGIEKGPILTDANGYARFDDLQEGKWSWNISAPSHGGRAGTVDVIANQTVGVNQRLAKSLVTIKFSVVPVPFTDRYEIKLEQTFETRVPAPVMVFDPPKVDFEGNEPFEVDILVNLTNHGLISVFDVVITGSSSAHMRMTPLIDFIPQLRAQQTVEIPVKITFSGFDKTLASGSLSYGGAIPQIIDPIPDACNTGMPSIEDIINGLMAIAKMGANGGYACADGDLGTIAAVLLGAATGYKAATDLVGGNFVKTLINLGGVLFGKIAACFDFGGLYNPGGGGGSGPSHSSGPRPEGDGSACFVAGTLISMADGSFVPIEELQPDMEVLTSKDGQSARIAGVFTLAVDNTIEMALANGIVLETTREHRIWVDGTGWKAAEDLTTGDWLQLMDGTCQQITSTSSKEGAVRVYTIQLEDDSAFFANGVLVEDLCGGANIDPSLFRELEIYQPQEETR